jgi:hypothetical protein
MKPPDEASSYTVLPACGHLFVPIKGARVAVQGLATQAPSQRNCKEGFDLPKLIAYREKTVAPVPIDRASPTSGFELKSP